MIWKPRPKKNPREWHRTFVWLPTSLIDGRRAALCFVERRMVQDGDAWTDPIYQYRAIPEI